MYLWLYVDLMKVVSESVKRGLRKSLQAQAGERKIGGNQRTRWRIDLLRAL